MCVNTIISLPENVQVGDVANVIGILAGLKPEKKTLQDRSDNWYVTVPGVEVAGLKTSPGMATIIFDSPVDEEPHFVYYHFENVGGGRVLCPPSTTFWITIARGLVKFFGGTVDYQDCDNTEVNYRVKAKSNSVNNPQDGKPYQNFQQRLLDLKPITKEDLKDKEHRAAYQKA